MKSTNVISGAESFLIEGNKTGILLCHGFNGTPQSVRYLGEKLANEGYTVQALRLTGHGSTVEEMENAKYEDWLNDLLAAYQSLKKQCDRVFVMGQSMGGALALQLAAKVKCDGLITINAALTVPEYEQLVKETPLKYIDENQPDIKDPQAIEITYDQVPLQAIHELIQTMKETKKQLPLVECPILLFHSIDDHVVPISSSYEIFEQVNSIEKIFISLKNSYHVASLDFDKDKIVNESIRFIQNQLEKKEAVA